MNLERAYDFYEIGFTDGVEEADRDLPLLLKTAWWVHLAEYDHGEDHGCDPTCCLSMILNELDKLRRL